MYLYYKKETGEILDWIVKVPIDKPINKNGVVEITREEYEKLKQQISRNDAE